MRDSSAQSVWGGYAVIALTYGAVAAFLLSSAWTGSVARLWIDAQLLAGTLAMLLAASAVHIALSAATYRFAERSLMVRRIVLASSVLLAVAALLRAVVAVWFSLQHASNDFVAEAVLPAHLLGAAVYSLLAWMLGRAYETANKCSEATRGEPLAPQAWR